MATQDTSLPGAGRHNRRAALLLAGLFALAAGVIALSAHWYLQASHARLMRDTEQAMDAQAKAKAALLTVWSGSLTERVTAFAAQDMLRLFAATAQSAHISADDLRALGRDATLAAPHAEGAPDGGDPLKALAPRVPLMASQLDEFVQRNGFVAAALLDLASHAYLAAGQARPLGEADRPWLKAAAETRKPVFLPVRRAGNALLMDMAFPVYAPLYVDPSGSSVAALLLVTCDVLPAVRAADNRAEAKGYGTAILQISGEALRRLDPESPGGATELPGWHLKDGALPPAFREDPGLAEGGRQVFNLASPVPFLPWLVEQSERAANLEAGQDRLRKDVALVALLTAALTGVILIALWWALVGRNERAVAEQMRRLYLAASQQKQILDGINASLSASVVLNDMDGVILYANKSFASLAGCEAERLPGMRHDALGHDMARSLVAHTLAVHHSGSRASFTETLPAAGGPRYLLTSCSPFLDEAGRLSGVVSVYNDMTALALAQRRAQQMVTQTVNAFVRAIEAVDAYLCGHSSLMAQLACLLATRLGHGDADTQATLRTAASLSQVGMIRLPRDLITKTGALTPDERAQLRRHVGYAKEALAGIDFGLPVLPAITQMYERLDGSGYPEGLSGDAICLNARILAVANTFCAVLRPRSYRTARSMDEALEILSSTPPAYDPQAVQALRGLLETEEGRAFLLRLRGGDPKAALQ